MIKTYITLQIIIWAIVAVVLIFLAVKRLKNKSSENFEDRDS